MTSRAEALAVLERMAGGLEADDAGVARLLERASQQEAPELLRDVLVELGALALLRESQ